ncbi:MAG: ATPase, T2SS/T4P/T4SS family [Rhodopila sp.]
MDLARCAEFTFDRLDQIGILAGYLTGRDFDADNPFCGSTLRDGQRIQMCRPPATLPGVIAMAIRKPAPTARTLDDADIPDLMSEANQPVSRASQNDAELCQMLADRRYPEFFRLARRSGKTIDVCGVTGSGKTDFAKRLMQETHAEKRILTIESDAEYGPIGPRNTVNVFYNEQHTAMQPEKAVMAALRMRPDEIWFQETRGPEAFAVLRARAAGHRGGGTTWHAEEGKEIDALALMVRQNPSAAHLSDEKIRELCLKFVDVIVSCARTGPGQFRITRVWFKAAEQVTA